MTWILISLCFSCGFVVGAAWHAFFQTVPVRRTFSDMDPDYRDEV